jgi:hypothetical protein
MGIVAGADGSDRSIQVIDNGPLQVLSLESFPSPPTRSCAVVTEAAANTIIFSCAG